MESQRRRWHQFGLRFLFALMTIVALVVFSGYTWRQRRETSAALRRADQIARRAEAEQARWQQVAEQFNYERLMLYHVLGLRPVTITEYEAVTAELEDNPNAQKAVKEYEASAKSAGESLPRGQRSYPAIISHLSAELRRRDQQAVDREDTIRSLREERDRCRQDADEYKTRCQALEKTINELRKP
jgi:hypothetical protein